MACALTLTPVALRAANPWVKPFTPLRQFYVSPSGVELNVALDYSGNGRHGTRVNYPQRTDGLVTPSSGTGRAVDFNGANHCITIPSVCPWGADCTMSAWIKTTSTLSHGSVNYPILCSWNAAGAGGVGQSFGINGGRLDFSLGEDSVSGCGDNNVRIQGSLVSDGNWHHVAVTINQSTKTARLYRDGRLDAQGSFAAIGAPCGLPAIQNIGHSGPTWPNTYLRGTLDEVRAYNRVLSDAELLAQYNGGQGQYGTPESGLVAGWHLDEGGGEAPTSPITLLSAIDNCNPGDVYWMMDGTYTGSFTQQRSGTAANPIVFRAAQGHHPIVQGGFWVKGDYIWYWGLDMSDTAGINAVDAPIYMDGAGIQAINNQIHHAFERSGIAAWNSGPGQVIYGNTIYNNGGGANHAHGIYTQNTYSRYGYKYFVNNFFLDAAHTNENSFNFHAYGECVGCPDPILTGFWVEKNTFKNGRFLIGGLGLPVSECVVQDNYYHGATLQIGYRRPTHARVVNNYLARTWLETKFIWGAGTSIYPRPGPSIYTNNEVVLSPYELMQVGTSIISPTGQCDGCPRFMPDDIIDYNRFSSPFKGGVHANGVFQQGLTFDQYRNLGIAAGNAIDAHSTLNASTTGSRILLVPNEYEPGRVHLTIINWDRRASVAVNFGSVLPAGAPLRVMDAKNFFGAPVFTANNNGPVDVPTGGAEFVAYIVLSTAPAAGLLIAPVSDRSVAEGATLTIANSATLDGASAANVTYSLVSAPAGATITPNGVFTWTPTEAQGPSTSFVTVQGVASGSPPQSATRSFNVTVTEVNSAPTLAALVDRTVEEGTLLSVINTATDSDVPAQSLTYSLDPGAPAGVSINPASGVLNWTPTESQGPGTYTITVRLTDNGAPSLNTARTFSVTVTEANNAPTLSAASNTTVTEGTALNLTFTGTDSDLPAQALTYSLDPGAPSGTGINPTTGAFTWTPTETQGPGNYSVTVRVTDNGSPAQSASRTFTVTVTEANVAPALAPIANASVLEGTPLTIAASGTDPDLPPQALTYSLDSGAPAGASIHPTTGVFSWTPTTAQGPATYPVTIRVSDNGSPSLNAARSFTITVTDNNTPPALAAIADVTVAEGSSLTFTNIATDADVPAQTVTYSLDAGAPGGATVNPTTGVFAWTPNEAQGPGSYAITVRATDSGNPALSATRTFTVNVGEANVTPILAVIPNASVQEGTLLTVSVSATDSDLPAQTLTYSLDSGAPAGASIHPNTGVFTWTPTLAQGPATYTVTVRVADNGTPALNTGRSFTITVTDNNSAPVLAAISDVSMVEGSTLRFANSASDADLPAQTLTYSLDPGAPSGATVSPATGVFNWTPTEAQGPGTFAITVRVTDNGSPALSTSRSFNVTVSEANTTPVLAVIPNASVAEGTPLTVNVNGSDPDLPIQTLTYSLDPGAPAGAAIHPTTGVFSWTPTAAQGPAAYNVTVRVADNGSPSLNTGRSFTITVTDNNIPPVLAAIGDVTLLEGSTLTFTNIATDADLPAQTLTFSLDGGAPAGATVSPTAGVFTWTPSEAQGPGNYAITVRVTDSGNPALSATRTFNVSVGEANATPILALIPNASVAEGTPLTLTVNGSDADVPAQTLTYSLDPGSPAGASIQPATGVFSWTPTPAQGPATYSVTVRVADNGNPSLNAGRSFSITVIDNNSPPVLAPIGDVTLVEGLTLTFTNNATDADQPAQTLTYSLDPGAPGGAAVHPTTGVFAWTPSEAQGPGSYAITVRVTDSGNPALSATRTFNVSVSEANATPILAAIPNASVQGGNPLTVSVNASDSDLPAQTLTYSLDPGAPAGASIHPSTGVFTWTPTVGQGPATYTVTVRVADNGAPALNAARSFTITVTDNNSTPVLAAIGDVSMVEGFTLSFANSASDADQPAQTLTYSLDAGAPAGALVHPTTGVFTWAPTEAQGPGTYAITVRVTDSGNPALSASRTFNVTISEVNSTPILAVIPNASVLKGTTLTFTVNGSDPDVPVQALTYSLDPGAPAGATIHPTTGVFSWTPTAAQGPATYTVTVRVADNGSPSLNIGHSFTVTVTGTDNNTPPVLAAIGDVTIAEGSTLIFTNVATDTDIPVQTLTYSLDAGAPTGASVNPTTGVFTWTPTEAQGPGNYSVTVRVTDSGIPAVSTSRSFNVSVGEVNTAPTLVAIPDTSVLEGTPLTVTASGSDSDVPVQALIYSLDLGAPAGASIHPTTGVFTWTPTTAQGPATYTVTVRLADNGNPPLNTTRSFAITVTDNNLPPVLAPIGDVTLAEGATLTFTNRATDADLPAQTLSYSLDAGAPVGAALDPATGVFTWRPTEAQGPGNYAMTVRVTDGGTPALTASRTFNVTVNEANTAPILAAIPDASVLEGTPLAVAVSGSDTDLPAQTLTYSLDSGAPAGATIHPTSGVFTWTPTAAQGPAAYTLSVRVTDNGSPSLSAAQALRVTVTEQNVAPYLTSIPNMTVIAGTPVTVTNSAFDVDGPPTALRYSIDPGVPAEMAIDPASGTISWPAPYSPTVLTQLVVVRVTDAGVPPQSSHRFFYITVIPTNRAPVIATIDDQVVAEGAQLSLTISASDPDGSSNGLTYGLDPGSPEGLTIDAVTGVLRWVPTEAQGPSASLVTVRATDNGTPRLTAKRSFRVVVGESNRSPTLAPILDATVEAGGVLTVTNTATDPDLPVNVLTFSLAGVAPPGAAVHPITGVFQWSPSEAQAPSTNRFSVVVSDNGTPVLTATQNFTVVVVPGLPVLPEIAAQTVVESRQLTLPEVAQSVPNTTGRYIYSLVGTVPAGATVNPGTGAFVWTPTESQGPSTNVLTLKVQDLSYPDRAATRTFQVVVLESNSAPNLAATGDRVVVEGRLLTVTNTVVDLDLPVQQMTYALEGNVPDAMVINPVTGVLTWTPGETQGPGAYVIAVRVSDNGSPNLSSTRSFTVTVRETNSPPAFAPMDDLTVEELTTLVLTNRAVDPDVPANTCTYSLGPDAPEGLTLDAATGVVTWRPTEDQGPSTNRVIIWATDNGIPSLSATQTVTIVVTERNADPYLNAIADLVAVAGVPLVVSNSAFDLDRPAQRLSYFLEAGGPPGVRIDSVSGRITWTPPDVTERTTNHIVVAVADDAQPPGRSHRFFTVTVVPTNGVIGFGPMEDQIAVEGVLLRLTNATTSAVRLASAVTYGLEGSVPSGLTLDPVDGVLSWIPTEMQGPSTNVIRVRAEGDAGRPVSGTTEFRIVVLESNSPPALDPVPDQFTHVGLLLTLGVSAMDPDWPMNDHHFRLRNAPAGVGIDGNTGELMWLPQASQVGSHRIEIEVTDNGIPSLTTVGSLSVTVSSLIVESIRRADESVILSWNVIPGVVYRVQYQDTVDGPWSDLAGPAAMAAAHGRIIDSEAPGRARFYRVLAEP